MRVLGHSEDPDKAKANIGFEGGRKVESRQDLRSETSHYGPCVC